MSDKINQDEYAKMALEKAEENHIWINAFSCIRPTPEFLQELGASILARLNNKDNLLPSSSITSDNETVRELAEMTPYLYIAINKS